jgi:predicted dehydrogenase
MDNALGVGIIGCGSVMSGPYMNLVQSLQRRGLVEPVAACDIKEVKRDFVRNKFGISAFSTDFADVVRFDEVDLVLVLTAMQDHGRIARSALEAGKHVLVEKPMATGLEEAAGLVEAARKHPGHLLCAPHVVLSPTYQAMWRHIERGDIGKVHLARARYGWSGPSWGAWYYLLGGGPLFDLGVYNVTSLTGWFGPARRVTAMAGTAIPERMVDGERISVETEDNFQILIDFGDAFFASITTGFSMQLYRNPAIELYGGEGTLQMMGDDWAPQGYELYRNRVGTWEIFPERDAHWPWTDGLRHLIECINNGTEPIITPEHAYHVTEIMVKATESAREGQAKTIHSTFSKPVFEDAEEEPLPAHLIHDERTR